MIASRRNGAVMLVVAVLLTGACTADGEVTNGDPRPSGTDSTSSGGIGVVSAKDVRYSSDVDVIDRPNSVVVWEVDADGSGYTLAADAPGVDRLAVGRVLLVKNEAVGRIRELTRTGDRVHVRVDPVSITDVIAHGELTWSDATADLGHLGVLAWNDPAGVTTNSPSAPPTAPARVAPMSPPQPRLVLASARYAAAEDSAEVTVGEYRLRVTCTAGANGAMAMTLEISRRIGQAEIAATATMNVSRLSSSGRIQVDEGRVTTAQFATDVRGTVRLEVKAVKADPGVFAFNEVVNVPVVAYWPVLIYGIPFTLVAKAKVLIAPAVSSGGTNLSLGADFTFGGASTTTINDGSPSGQGGLSVENRTTIDDISGVSLGASGFVVAIRPRFGFGLGAGAAGSTAFTDFVASVGVTSGSALGLVACKQLNVVLTPRVGVEAHLLGASAEFVKPIGESKFSDYTPRVTACKL